MKYLLLIIPIIAFAGERHHEHDVTNITNVSQYSVSGISLGIAASQHHFDASTYHLQGSVGIGAYNGSNALSIGLGKRFCKGCGLVNGTFGIEGDKTAIGAGWSFQIK